jgi:HEAT repeat protein
MRGLRAILGSTPLLAILVLVTTAAWVVYATPASSFVAERSTSVVTNFYLLGGLMILVALSAAAQALLLIRLLWGKEAVTGESTDRAADEGDEFDEMRAMRATGLKKAVVLGILLAANIVAADVVGDGMVFWDTRAYHTLTLLRSESGDDRRNAAEKAVLLIGDDRIAAALRRVIDEPGEGRDWAAYAAGVRHDEGSADSLVALAKSGEQRERVAAVLALARLKNDRLIQIAPEVYPGLGELRGDLLKALGMLGRRQDTSATDLKTAGSFLSQVLVKEEDIELKRVAMWALGSFNAPEGLAPVERLLETAGDSATLCIGLETLGRIGSASSSPRMVAMLETVDRSVRCPEMVYADYTGHEVLLSESIPVVERLLREIARIGDRRARPAMEELAKDEGFSATARKLAAEIAFQMKYKPVPDEPPPPPPPSLRVDPPR